MFIYRNSIYQNQKYKENRINLSFSDVLSKTLAYIIVNVIKLLANNVFDINVVDMDGMTPAHTA